MFLWPHSLVSLTQTVVLLIYEAQRQDHNSFRSFGFWENHPEQDAFKGSGV